ncbi:MAG: hypothetical protein ABJA66_12570 [Actinomycetota bacterium]
MASIILSVFYIFVPANFSCGQTKEAAKPPPLIEFRLIDRNDNSPDALRLPVSGDVNQSVAVKPEIIINGADITAVKTHTEKFWLMFKRYERSSVQINFTDAGTQRLKAAIQNNIGEFMAIIIDGKVVCQALMRNSLKGNTFVLEAGMTRDETAKLARLLRKG